jgi:hypothetical protein
VSRSHLARVARLGAVSTALALLSEGWPVFVKRVPTCYQFGVGSPGFGA